jgi:hypothetical protein
MSPDSPSHFRARQQKHVARTRQIMLPSRAMKLIVEREVFLRDWISGGLFHFLHSCRVPD